MKKTIADILKMKEVKMSPFENEYVWFFTYLEDLILTKSNGNIRAKILIDEYNKEAQEYIVHQLFKMNEDVGSTLIDDLNLKEPFVSDENIKHLEDNL